jgi:hypothetical protein
MIDDGIYGLDYIAPNGDMCDGIGSLLVVLREGKILGSDNLGGVFSGNYEFSLEEALNKIYVRMRIPPRGELVTGYAAGPEGAILDIVGAVTRTEAVTVTRVEVAGEPIDVRLTYIGPLPN